MRVGLVDLQGKAASADFYRTLRKTGFAVITGHSVSTALIAAVHAGWQQFFDGADKDRYRNTGEAQWGYWPPSISETAVGAEHRDLKEFFQVGPKGELPDELRSTVLEYQALTLGLGSMLLEWLEDSLPAQVLAPGAQGLSGRLSAAQSLLRIVHYPPLASLTAESTGPVGIRAAAHEDINLITVLPVAEEPGLQVQDQAGRWHSVHGSPGQIIVNAGDMLAEATGGFIRSTTHRVSNPVDAKARRRSRIAAPMFLAPHAETKLSERYTAGSYLAERLALIGLQSPAAPAEPPP